MQSFFLVIFIDAAAKAELQLICALIHSKAQIFVLALNQHHHPSVDFLAATNQEPALVWVPAPE